MCAGMIAGDERKPALLAEAVVTRKTVESHLSRIYRKLEIAGRAELPDALSG